MSNTDLSTLLKESQFGEVFSSDLIDELATLAQAKSCKTGTILFREGEYGDAFYIVHRGRVSLEMQITGQGGSRVLTLGPGDLIAWSALIGDGQMTATAIATEDTELIELSAANVLQICEKDFRYGYLFMRRLATAMAKRLQATRLQMLDLFKADASSSAGTIYE